VPDEVSGRWLRLLLEDSEIAPANANKIKNPDVIPLPLLKTRFDEGRSAISDVRVLESASDVLTTGPRRSHPRIQGFMS
jgi:hypothetical protein